MNLTMNPASLEGYTSGPQKIRKITEQWAVENLYCPCCGNPAVRKYENNRPAADFYCPDCREQYELKSRAGKIGPQVVDGAYHTMISRILSESNPNFFFLQYERQTWSVKTLVMVPKYFFSPDLIIRRPPLTANARRPGWIGCKILYSGIPEHGKIRIIADGQRVEPEQVLQRVEQIRFVSSFSLKKRGWTLETFKCIERIPKREFTLKDVYQFIPELQEKHPGNGHIREKLRQQVQILRDRGILLSVRRGVYRKTDSV